MVAPEQAGRDRQDASCLHQTRARSGPAAPQRFSKRPAEADSTAAEYHEPGDHEPRIARVVGGKAADLRRCEGKARLAERGCDPGRRKGGGAEDAGHRPGYGCAAARRAAADGAYPRSCQ
jgi:hypothetical protein